VDEIALDEALEHCETCPDCAAFARALATLDAIPAPSAPDRVVRRALDAVREEAALATSTPEPSAAVSPEDDHGEPSWWERFFSGPRFAVVASAAVVFVAAVFVTVRFMTAGLPDTTSDQFAMENESGTGAAVAERSEQQLDADDDAGAMAPQEAEAETGTAPAEDVVREAPPFVLIEGLVYRASAEISGKSVEPARVAQTVSAKDSEDGILRTWGVYEDAAGLLFLESSSSGSYAPLTLVTREFDDVVYALTTDRPIEAYGDWPALPSYITAPVREDGAPVFIVASTDSRGVTVYVRLGRSADEGIAVPPGTPSGDPARGNPGWTWWPPLSE
jgi:hypothetical protein